MLAIPTMAPISIIGALSALPLVLAHMQMSSPSPLRDPHATDRPQEPKDYNILSPLNADGSNFACKGYHLNTPLTTVATYAAGSKQTLRLKGSATHGGGSCQISMSCDGGNDFRVMKSIVGGCPLKDSYDFTVPKDMPAAKKCLLAWTWFNRIGNREMYMNCAVVDITNKNKGKRDTQASAVTALARFPELFVANLANINSCKIQETTDAIFDDPGKDVSYGNGDSSSMKSAFSKGQCTGKPSKNAGSKDTSSSNSGGGGQWTPPAKSPSQAGDCVAKIASGQWHPECSGGQSQAVQQRPQPQQQEQVSQQSQQPQKTKQNARKKLSKGKPNTRVQEELDAYLATLSGRDVARRDAMPAAKRHELHSRLNENSINQHAHIHTENCEHEMDDYAPVSHYRNEEDLDPYPEDGIDFSNKNAYSTQDSQNDEDPYSSYKRVSRQQRWTSYNKRADTPRVPITFHRGDESAYYKQRAQNQASTDVVKDTSAEASSETPTDTTASAPDEAPAKKNWSDMTDSERFNAYLQRMVELSNNLASLIKYAAASSVNVPYYPSAARGIAPAPESVQGTASEGTDTAVPRLARRGVLSHSVSSAQAYPGPGNIGSISDAGEATDSDDGFRKWFPNLVQTSRAKRQLVDPVTSEASAQAGDSVNFFDALLAGISKLFGDPFNLYNDDPDTSGAPDPEDIPLVLGEPDIYSKPPFIPDFDIPDLDGHFNFPPQIPAPELPVPELLPGGESDPLTDDFPADVPTIIISIDPVTSTDDVFPGLDVPTMTPCVQPIPQTGFNSCWGGCNHTAEEIAQHEVYLKTFAEEEAAYNECLANQTSDNSSSNGNSSSHSHKILYEPDDDSEDGWQFEPEDASGRKPRPGQSLPLIPSPIPNNYTLPYPLNSTDPFNSTETASSPTLDTTDPGSNATDSLPLLPYQNKTLGELVNDILKNPVMLDAPEGEVVNDTNTEAIPGLTPVPSDSSDDLPPIDQPSGVVNPLQEAADQAEQGVTVPQDPAVVEPNALETIADALPWFMGHGPVVTPGVSAGVIGLQ